VKEKFTEKIRQDLRQFSEHAAKELVRTNGFKLVFEVKRSSEALDFQVGFFE
jgi:hypothetical protein